MITAPLRKIVFRERAVTAHHAEVSCQVRQEKLLQLLYQGCQGAGRPTGDGDRGFGIKELREEGGTEQE
jgi:hypothetical protein